MKGNFRRYMMKIKYDIPRALPSKLDMESELLASSSLEASTVHDVGSEELTYDGFDSVVNDWD